SEGFSTKDINGRWVGFYPEIVGELSRRLNFQATFKRVSDGRYGSYDNQTGRWDGMIGDVYSGDVHFAAAPLTLNAVREEFVDFSHGVLNFGLVVVAKPAKWVNTARSSGCQVFPARLRPGRLAGLWRGVLLTALLLHYNGRYNPAENGSAVSDELRCQNRQQRGGPPVRPATLGNRRWRVWRRRISTVAPAAELPLSGPSAGFSKWPRSLAGALRQRLLVAVSSPSYAATYSGGFLCALVATEAPQLRPCSQQFQPEARQASLRETTGTGRLLHAGTLIDLVLRDTQILGVMEAPMADFLREEDRLRDQSSLGDLTNDKSYAFAFAENSSLTGGSTWRFSRLKRASPAALCGQQDGGLAAARSRRLAKSARMFPRKHPVTLNSFPGPLILRSSNFRRKVTNESTANMSLTAAHQRRRTKEIERRRVVSSGLQEDFR
uniref:Lig_chan-Glu_bd domain-containing protein n=1 Tax=Macrostomum lignano TaxID=282301 RepID=A0A1I8FCX7_9PLAT